MNRKIICFLGILIYCQSYGQPSASKVTTSDIDNFWIAYDSIRTTKDSIQQIHFITTLYIDKGTPGLHAFMKARDYTAARWVGLINQFPKFWNSIRSNTLQVKSMAREIDKSISRLKELYPYLQEAKIYFTIGALRSGGTTTQNMVLIGTEIATGTVNTDVSEFPDKWLESVFKTQDTGNIIALNIHEYVHTQQRGTSNNLLSQCIREGSCDFITELVMGKPLTNHYIQYGNQHEPELKDQFKLEMFTSHYNNWLYNGASAKTVADLGYFMGYAICKAYYHQASDKRKAISDIIQLNYSNNKSVEKFLRESRYYPDTLNKEALIRDFEAKRPTVMQLEPFKNGATNVDPSIKEMKIIFSEPMNKKHFSIDYGSRGKDFSPIAGIVGYSDDGTSFTLKMTLQPDHEYEFRLTDLSYKSEAGYPLKPLDVKFKTSK